MSNNNFIKLEIADKQMAEKFVESRPINPKNGDKYRDKDGVTHVFFNGRFMKRKNK